MTKMGQINSISVIARERDDREDQKIHPNKGEKMKNIASENEIGRAHV